MAPRAAGGRDNEAYHRPAAVEAQGMGGPLQRKYDHGLKYENGDKYDHRDQVNGNSNVVSYRNAGRENYENTNGTNGNANNGGQVSPAALQSLDKRISSVQQHLNSALQEVTSKDNEKFDLIFSILVELQKRQAQLEDSMRTLKAQLNSSTPCMEQQQQQQQQQSAQPSGQGRGQQQAVPSATQPGGQVAQMGHAAAAAAMGGYLGGQFVASADGSPAAAYFAPVVLAMPQNGAQLPYGMPQMMQHPGSPMHPLPQQMAVQLVGQDDYSWGDPAAAAQGAAESVAAAARASAGGAQQQGAEGATAQEGQTTEAPKTESWGAEQEE